MRYGLFFGGLSFEHEISIVSAISLKEKLNNISAFIFCDENREFYLIEPKNMISKNFSSKVYKNYKKLFLDDGGFFEKTFFGKKKVEFDVAINLSHGGDGEDGKIAAIFDFFKIPYIGPRIEASVVSFNKVLTKTYAKEIGVKTLEYQTIRRSKQLESLNFPIIIKPACLGSSIGVSVARDEMELEYALDVAYEFDDLILAEPFVEGVKEYNLAGCKIGNDFEFSIIEEPQKGAILDFDKKYLDFSRPSKAIKANIDKNLEDKIKQTFEKIYNPLFLGALIRCDFFVIGEDVYLNEINPVPGSLSNYLFDDYQKIIDSLAQNLPKNKKIAIEYKYINSISAAKGK